MTPAEQSSFRFWVAVLGGSITALNLMTFGGFLNNRQILLLVGLMVFWGMMAAMNYRRAE